MAVPHSISGLLKKRDELGTEARQLETRLKEITEQIATLELAVKIITPLYKLKPVHAKRRTKNAFFGQGEATRFILDTLKEATAPISTTDQATLAAQAKGMDPDKIDFKAMEAGILTVMSRKRVDGVVVECGRAPYGSIMWKLAGG